LDGENDKKYFKVDYIFIIRKIKIHAHENTKETHTGQHVSAQHVSHSKTELPLNGPLLP
jgi:hypothetical protein